MRNMKRAQQGFTLIELMIVIAIVAILVALAVPAYQDYTIRAKVGECINGAAPFKLAISEYYESEGVWPLTRDAAGITADAGDSDICAAVTYTGGQAFTVVADNAGAGGNVRATFTGSATAAGQPVDWTCSNPDGATTNKYLPSSCRGT